MIEKLVVIGTGLIGGSLIRSLRETDSVGHVVGCARKAKTLDTALTLNIIDEAVTNPAKAVIDADVVVLAVPVGAIKSIVTLIAPNLKAGAIVTDVGSVKSTVIEDVKSAVGEMPRWFVPGHPIAGTENSGIEASFASLFVDRQVILTPEVETNVNSVEIIQKMWESTGAKVSLMSAEEHDRILAATSHLPHILAYTLVDQLSHMEDAEPVFKYAAGGFRDLSRIASSDPTMWRDICMANGEEITKMIKSYKKNLTAIEQYIENKDDEKLFELFSGAKKARDSHFE